MRLFIIVFAVFVIGCQFLLPDLKAIDGDGGSGSNLSLNGEDCLDNTDCESGNCTNAVCCDPGGYCCNQDAQCLDNLACDTGIFECYAECGPGGTDHDDYCASGYHCDANTCWEDIAVGGCNEDSDCVSGECIDDNCCEHAGLCCGENADCPDLFDGCSTDDTKTCVYSSFSFPDTGQADECYDVGGAPVDCSTITSTMDYYGQDGHYPGPVRSYDDSNIWIVDQVTGLSWMVEGTDQMDWENASSMCESETAGSMTWRLPKRHELVSIVDYRSGGGVGADSVFNLDPATEKIWTATELAGSESSTAWAVNFDTGGLVRVGKSDSTLLVICVTEN